MSQRPIPELIKLAASAALNAAYDLVPEWLPDGKQRGAEWVAINPRRADGKAGSFSVSLITGKWNDYADREARGGDLVGLLAYLESITQLAAAKRIDRRLALGLFATWDADTRQVNSFASDRAIQQAEAAHKAALLRQRQADREKLKNQEAAARIAERLWNRARKPRDDHPYLVRKRIPATGLREDRGSLLVPLYGRVGENTRLVNIQIIKRSGEKRFLTGGRTHGCYAPIGNVETARRVYVCEGWATGITLHWDTGTPVLCAMTAGNLYEVACYWRDRRGSGIEIIVAGDDDRKNPDNPGRSAAEVAAKAAGALLVFPNFPDGAPLELSDFNDLHLWLTQQPDSLHEVASLER